MRLCTAWFLPIRVCGCVRREASFPLLCLRPASQIAAVTTVGACSLRGEIKNGVLGEVGHFGFFEFEPSGSLNLNLSFKNLKQQRVMYENRNIVNGFFETKQLMLISEPQIFRSFDSNQLLVINHNFRK